MAVQDGFSEEKMELLHRLQAIDSRPFFAQLRILMELHLAQSDSTFELTEADKQAILAGREDVAEGRMHSLEEFRKFFAKYEV